MILCIDAGNSRLKWGLCESLRNTDKDGCIWRACGVMDYATAGPLVLPLLERPQRLLACNVAGADVAARIDALATTLAVPLAWFRSSAAMAGVTNGYDIPAQLGADRWAALIGARALHTGPALVVMAGTATTIDVLDAGGVFRGGLILPGLDLMRRALVQNTAGLSPAQGGYREIPTHTDDAIISGSLAATLGAIERMAQHVFRDIVHTDFLCLLSGGAAGQLAPYLDFPHRAVDNLVLEGLARFAMTEQSVPDDLL